jgi:hypothetical protein
VNWKKRVSVGRASLRFAVLWTAFWVAWFALAATDVYPTDGDFDKGWIMGWAAAFVLDAIFTIIGVVTSLRLGENRCCKCKQPKSQPE